MRFTWLTISAASLALAGCGGGADEPNLATAEGGAVENEGPAPVEGSGASPAAPPTAANGQQYVDLAGGSDLYEIESARLAQEKATRPEIRSLAQMILADHQRSTAELGRAAGQAQPPLTAAPRLNPEQQANVQALRTATGAAFDQEYLRQQVRAHEQALTLVTAYAAGGEVEPLRAHASSVAGPIQTHLARARELAAPPPQ
ncbi:MAG TPA: DUF4142 domain-containing protein [Allosphingosinicella sp.]|nr:DUF4142 domain-containing protein [Allosphingosinicella sp.]